MPAPRRPAPPADVTPAARTRRGAAARAERRQDILLAARDVFARRGYHQATIDDIVAAAGVARGTFYLYYEDKRAVFSDLIDRFSQQLTLRILRIRPDDPQTPVAAQVRENLRGIVATCLAERAMTKMLLTDAVGIDPAFDRRLQAFYEAVVQLLAESLREGQGLGLIRDGEPKVLAYLSLGALKELLFQAVTLGLREESADALTEQIFSFLRVGYLRFEEPAPAATRAAPARRRRARR